MIEKLITIDKELFLFLNGLHHPFFDFFFWWASNAWTWVPVYIILFYLSLKVYRKQIIFIVLFTAICIAATDLVSVHFFKEVFLRLRPTHDPDIKDKVHILNNYLGGKYGFVSSHATNFAGLATFFSVIFFKKVKFFIPAILLWVAIIGYSRIYLGVHYPADVVVGILVGVFIGFIIGFLFRLFSIKVLNKTAFFRINNSEETNTKSANPG